MKNERFDIHQHTTDKIVSAIERGTGDFLVPWRCDAGNIMRPINVASKKAYRGVNVVALWAHAEETGYSSGTWGTYKQCAEAGAQVRKGEKAAFVVFYKDLETATDPEAGEAETATRLFARATPVFAAEQVDGYQVPVSDQAYAVEELVAELGAAFLCADLRIADAPRTDHAQHLASWLAVLKEDKKAIFTAASKASEATAFVASLQPYEPATKE
jgi:antirestriction protein ArdC